MVDETTQPTLGQAPFNMAIATLMRLDEILKEITSSHKRSYIHPDNPSYMPKNYAQQSRIRLIKELFLNAAVLMKADKLKEIKPKIEELKGFKKKSSDNEMTYSYSEEIEQKIFNLSLEIQMALQENGVFMPTNSKKNMF